jgi:heptosyltransferase-2/heptosyltransferase-3
MERITPPAERMALAEKHRQERARAPERNARQRLRLRLLRQWGAAYRTQPAAAGPVPQRILVIRPDHLGDLLFATPALHLLRQRFPAAHIAALLGPWGAPVLANSRDVDEILTCPFPGFTRQPASGLLAPYRLLSGLARQLRDQQFDTALILRFDHWWGAWLAAAAGVPKRIGFDIGETRPFLTQAVAYALGRHEVAQNLALVQDVTGDAAPGVEQLEPGKPRLRFEVGDGAEQAAGTLLARLGDQPLIAIHPGSGALVKRWRTEAWAELASQLCEQYSAQVVFTGTAAEAALIEPIRVALNGCELAAGPISLAGQTNLSTLAAVYRRCSLIIGPDSGPLHLAVAMGTPTVHLYGPVDQATFGPWGAPERHRVVISNWSCVPCNHLDWPVEAEPEHGCVRDIAVAQVLEATAGLLG